jgi:hypothetical protein
MQFSAMGYGKLRMDKKGALPPAPRPKAGRWPGAQPRSRITSRTRATIVPALGICCISTSFEKLIGV